MGYFKRKISRARLREESRSLREQPLADIPWEALEETAPKRYPFVRFSTPLRDADSGRRAGIFVATCTVLDDPDLHPTAREALQSTFEWFVGNLESPNLANEKAIFFFKSDAADCMARAWELIHQLREAGVVIEMQWVERPGRILYEDENQIAVVPWADAEVR